MALVRGPFNIKWGDNTLSDIESVETEYEVASDEYETIQGKNIEVDGAHKAAVTITLLSTDIPSLSIVLPQHFVANGQEMSTGETVNNADGAIDITPLNCGVESIFNNLDIISCGNPANVTRLVNARSRIEGIEIDNKIQKVMVKFIGESASDEATMQFFRQGTINVVS